MPFLFANTNTAPTNETVEVFYFAENGEIVC